MPTQLQPATPYEPTYRSQQVVTPWEEADARRQHALARKAKRIEQSDGSIKEYRQDGSVWLYSVQEVQAERQQAAQDLADMEDFVKQMQEDRKMAGIAREHDVPYVSEIQQQIADSITVTTVELPADPPVTATQQEQLLAAAVLMDSDLETVHDREQLADLLNAYAAGYWRGLPLFETFRDPYGRWRVGYRANMLQAWLLPADPDDETYGCMTPGYISPPGDDGHRCYDDEGDVMEPDEMQEPTLWQSDDGRRYLHRIIQIVVDGADEAIEDGGIRSENGPFWMPLVQVRSGRVYHDHDWQQLRELLDNSTHVSLRYAIPNNILPITVVGEHKHRAWTVASWMNEAQRSDWWDQQFPDDYPDSFDAERDAELIAEYGIDSPACFEARQRIQQYYLPQTDMQLAWATCQELLANNKAWVPWMFHGGGPNDYVTTHETQVLYRQMQQWYQQHGQQHGLEPVGDTLWGRPQLMPAAGWSSGDDTVHRLGYRPNIPLQQWWRQASRQQYEATVGKWVVLNGGGPYHIFDGNGYPDQDSAPLVVVDQPEPALIDAHPTVSKEDAFHQDHWQYAVFVPGDLQDGEILQNPAYDRDTDEHPTWILPDDN